MIFSSILNKAELIATLANWKINSLILKSKFEKK